MSGSGISNQDNFEDFLLSNQFYVGPSNSQNHITNLRKSVQIPNSMSNTSIHAGLSNELVGANQQRTSIMKVSPSMKALESILSEKNNSAPAIVSERIVEEDEDQGQFPLVRGCRLTILPKIQIEGRPTRCKLSKRPILKIRLVILLI